jgi:hypothetical protein
MSYMSYVRLLCQVGKKHTAVETFRIVFPNSELFGAVSKEVVNGGFRDVGASVEPNSDELDATGLTDLEAIVDVRRGVNGSIENPHRDHRFEVVAASVTIATFAALEASTSSVVIMSDVFPISSSTVGAGNVDVLVKWRFTQSRMTSNSSFALLRITGGTE